LAERQGRINMKPAIHRLLVILSVLMLTFSMSADAGKSFRTQSGRLITTGMSKVEVLDLIGEPLSRDVYTRGLSLDPISVGKTVETWSYLLSGSIGGEYYLTITLEDGYVIEVASKQRGRI